jgi:tellurite resistance protein TerC
MRNTTSYVFDSLVDYVRDVCGRMTVKTMGQAKRLIRIIVGFTLLAVGLALIVLPGPAVVVIPVALAILAGEFVWARRLLNRFDGGLRSLLRNRKKNHSNKKAGG